MIRKVKEGYRVVAESGRNLGTYKTETEAKKRLCKSSFLSTKRLKDILNLYIWVLQLGSPKSKIYVTIFSWLKKLLIL